MRRTLPEFTSAIKKREAAAVLAYLPVHAAVLPLVLGRVMTAGYITDVQGNVICYAIGTLYMLIAAGRFLRRDFDPLCDRPITVVIEIAAGYAMMFCCNMALSLLLSAFPSTTNPNNQAVAGLAMESYGPMAAMAVFLAPLVEEPLFRAGVFGVPRKRSRTAAYIVSVTLFSLYHVWGYAVVDPYNWVYILQYIPISILLCRCYERTNTIWSSIFFHMLINGISMRALMLLHEAGMM